MTVVVTIVSSQETPTVTDCDNEESVWYDHTFIVKKLFSCDKTQEISIFIFEFIGTLKINIQTMILVFAVHHAYDYQ